MQVNAKNRAPYLPILFSLYTLVFICFINRDTPFRAEHWALLSAMARASGPVNWTKTVSQFVCFGVQRFQPLAFFPTAFSYLLFHHYYLAHLLYGAILQIALAVAFIFLIHELRNAPKKLSLKQMMMAYAPELSLVMVLFPASDLVLWSFFHYIQWALLLATLATVLLLQDIRLRKTPRFWGILLACLATLIYEPFIVLVFLQAIIFVIPMVCTLERGRARSWKKSLPALFSFFFLVLFLVAIAVKYIAQYNDYYLMVARFNELQKSMVAISIPHKILFCVEKTGLALFTLAYSIVYPSPAVRNYIYEMAAIPGVKENLFDFHSFTYITAANLHRVFFIGALGGGLTTFALFRYRESDWGNTKRFFLVLLVLATGPFFLIAWGRPVFQDVAVCHQFRYSMVVAIPLLAIGLEIAHRLAQPSNHRWYVVAIYFLLFMNAVATVRHGIRVHNDMIPLQAYLQPSIEVGNSRDTIIRANRGIIEEELPLKDPSAYPFAYNAQKCIAEWKI